MRGWRRQHAGRAPSLSIGTRPVRLDGEQSARGLSMVPSPVVALNRAVALAEVRGADAALALVDNLRLDSLYLFHAIRADLLRRLGRTSEAIDAYDAAITRSENAAERAFLTRRRQTLVDGDA